LNNPYLSVSHTFSQAFHIFGPNSTGTGFALEYEKLTMEKKIIGIVLLVAGIGAMLFSGFSFMNGSGNSDHLIRVIIYMVVGAIAFFTGINMIVRPGDALRKTGVQSKLSQVSKNG
jgi:NO-binding membrane sensor protein with MHYT domain